VKAAVSFAKGERPVVHMFAGRTDFSSLTHESFHVWRRLLPEDAQSVLAKHFGDFSTVSAEERAARAFERYLRTGHAPTESLREVFEHARLWMRDIYRRLKGTPLEERVHPEVREVFDRMLGGGGLPVRRSRVLR
jgi:hypothetical protein